MNNLYSKVKLLVDDLEPLDKFGKARVITNFLEAELALKAETKHLDEVDVQTIQGRAADILVGTQMIQAVDHYDRSNFAKDPNYYRTACLIQATIELLRSKTLLTHMIAFRKDRQEIAFCSHFPTERTDSPTGWACGACGDWIRPTMWVLARQKS